MAVYNRYKKLRKAIKYADGTIVYIEPYEEKKGELVSQTSYETLEDCLYNYQYRWYQIELDEKDKNTYICEGYAQYYKEIYQKSLDNEHWIDVEPKQERKGELIKEYSESCGYVPLIEWRLVPIDLGNPNTYICEDGDLYTRENQYISYDNGLSYQPSGLSRKGNLYQSNSELCLNGGMYDANQKIMKLNINNEPLTYHKYKVFNISQWENENPDVILKEIILIEDKLNIRFNNFRPYFKLEFYNSLYSINCNGLYTNNMTDMSYMFYKCSSLTSLDLSSFDTSNVTDMSYMFYRCLNLTSLDLSNFDTSKVTNMGEMFGNNGASNYFLSLTSLDLSSFDTSNVTDMNDMFSGCSGLTSLDVTNFDTSKVTNMGGMFSQCLGLTSLDVTNFDTSNVTNMAAMFNSCSGLTSLDLSNFDTSKVTNMTGMFAYITNFKSEKDIIGLSSFDTSNVTTMLGMFTNCSGLTSLDLTNFDTSNVTDMYQMFSDCSSLTSLDLSSFDTSNATDMRMMFYQCNKLTSLDLSSFDTSKVTNMGGMFMYCFSLASLDLSNFDTSNVSGMSVTTQMFRYCDNLTHIKCKQAFRDWCWTNQYYLWLPTQMREGGSGTWEIVG